MYSLFSPVWEPARTNYRLPVRIIGRDLPEPCEPCTNGERIRALVFYSDALKQARAVLFQARLCGYPVNSEYAARCFAKVRRLEKERAVWFAASKYTLPDGMQARPFNIFAASKGGPQ